MKYLKKFNENGNWKLSINDLEEEANNYLAYLLDYGWDIDITNYWNRYGVVIYSYAFWAMGNDDMVKEWEDIKDYVIPYLEMVIEKYNVGEKFFLTYIEFHREKSASNGHKEYTVSELNDINPELVVTEIKFEIGKLQKT